MRTARKGFTLVEILIVVVILGILAAIVVPQFTSASQSAVKGALQTQLQTIESQVELYRVNESGALPHNDATSALGGPADANGEGSWGVMVSNEYMKDEPFNGYVKTSIVDTQAGVAEADYMIAAAAWVDTDPGWLYDTDNGRCYAMAYDDDDNLLANEGGDYGP